MCGSSVLERCSQFLGMPLELSAGYEYIFLFLFLKARRLSLYIGCFALLSLVRGRPVRASWSGGSPVLGQRGGIPDLAGVGLTAFGGL